MFHPGYDPSLLLCLKNNNYHLSFNCSSGTSLVWWSSLFKSESSGALPEPSSESDSYKNAGSFEVLGCLAFFIGDTSSDSDPYKSVGAQEGSCLSEALASGCLGLFMGLPSSDSEPYKRVGSHVGWVPEPLAPGCLGEVCLLSDDKSALPSDCMSDSELSINVGGMLAVCPAWDAAELEESLEEKTEVN